MGYVLDGLLLIGMLGVVASLGLGIYSMVRGGEFNERNGNRFMRWRVWMQAVSVGLVLLGAWYYGSRH